MSDLDGRNFLKRGNTLIPADFAADEMLATLKEGREVIMSMRRARSPVHHRFFFALLRQVVNNTEGKWADESDLLSDLKFATGHRNRRENLVTGDIYEVARSINFAAMSEDQFREFKDKCLDVLTRHLGWDPVVLMKEVEATQKRHAR